MSREELMACFSSVNDVSHLLRAREKSQGGIIGLTGHFGNWEYSAHWMSQNGFPLTAVGRDQEDEALNEQIVAIREQWGTKNVPRSRYANKTLIAALKEGRVLGLLSDQNAGRNGLFVPFFGEWASTFRGPAVFALKLRCPVIPVFNVRLPDDTYKLIIGPEIELIRDEDREYEIWASTYRMQRYIEALLTKYPEQWMWLHRRWKSRPDREALEKGRRFLERYEREVSDEFVIP
jgi:KDO2-lipid IV(A) lauroyltransferase